MRILIVPLTGGVGIGPLTHCLSVAYEARKRGHSVKFLCKKSFAKIVKRFEYPLFIAPSSKPSGINIVPFKLSDVAIELGLIDFVYIRESIKAERKAIKTFKPDIIFAETQLTIPISAGIEKIPFAATASWADHPKFTSPLFPKSTKSSGYEDRYNRILKQYKLKEIRDICELGFLRADLMIAPTIPKLQPELKQVSGVCFVGQLISPEMEEGQLPKQIEKWDKKRPVVYVYMSPGDIPSKEWIKTLIEGFAESEFNVIVTLSPVLVKASELTKLQNIIFSESVPGSVACRRADLVITHGGSNTVANALIAGKPLMVFSHYYAERDYNGRAIEAQGAGINFRTEYFNPKDILSFARKIYSDKRYSQNARRLGKSIKSLGGAKKAVDLLEKWEKNV